MGYTYRGIIISNFYDFVIGYITFLGFINKISRNISILIIVCFAIFIMLKVSYITSTIPLLTALFIIFYKNNKLPKYISFTGTISYSLYLVHLPVSSFLVSRIHLFITNTYLLYVLCLVISILFAYLFYILIEKPSMNLSKNLKSTSLQHAN